MPFDFPHDIIQYITNMVLERDESFRNSRRPYACRF